MKVKDPLVHNIDTAGEFLDGEISEFEEEAEDLRNFASRIPVILAGQNQSIVDGFEEEFYRKHGHKYDYESAEEALDEELEAEFDFLDERDRQSPSMASTLGSELRESIEYREKTVKTLRSEMNFLNSVHYEVDFEYRSELDSRPELFFSIIKDGEREKIKRDIFEENINVNPKEIESVTSYIGRLKAAEDYLESLAGAIGDYLEPRNTGYRKWLYSEQSFRNPVLDGIGTSLKAVRNDRKKIEEYLTHGTEHDHILGVWAEHLEQSLSDGWELVGTEIDYYATENGTHKRRGEFDIFIENSDKLVYLETKPVIELKSKAEDQIDRLTKYDEITINHRGETRTYDTSKITGYIVQGLPDYTRDPVELLENTDNKAVIG